MKAHDTVAMNATRVICERVIRKRYFKLDVYFKRAETPIIIC